MDYNYNQGGQFGGWSSSPDGFGAEMYNEQVTRRIEKRKRMEELRKIGSKCGIAVILYVAISYGLSFLLVLISWGFPSISALYTETNATLAFEIIVTIFAIVIPFLIIHYMMKKEKVSEVLPFGTTYDKGVATALVMIFIPVMILSAIAINSVSSIFQEMLGIEFQSTVGDFSLKGAKEIFMGVLSIAVVPAIVEELVIRGIVMQPLRKYGDRFAIIVSAVLFACMHGNMVQIPYTVVGGLLLGYLAVTTGSLWPSVILHFVNNLYSVIIIAVNDNFSENASVVATILMLVAFGVMGVIGVIRLLKLKHKMTFTEEKTLTMSEKISAFIKNGPVIVAIIMLAAITVTNIKF